MAHTDGWHCDRALRHRSGQLVWNGQLSSEHLQHSVERGASRRCRSLRVVVSLGPFGVLTSRMHMAWLRHIGGRLESRYRYSVGIVYNPFPWPESTPRQRERIMSLSQTVLDARASFPDSSLADLYDSDAMRPSLVRAHRALDSAVDRLYRSTGFQSDRERVEYLFGKYERLIMPPLVPVLPEAGPRRRHRGRRVI